MKKISIFLILFLFVGCGAKEEKVFDKNDYNFVTGVPVRIIPIQEDGNLQILHIEFEDGRFIGFRVWSQYLRMAVIKLRRVNKIYYDNSSFIKLIEIEE
jgi:hypothetical protein